MALAARLTTPCATILLSGGILVGLVNDSGHETQPTYEHVSDATHDRQVLVEAYRSWLDDKRTFRVRISE